jgi:hypothetical protein
MTSTQTILMHICQIEGRYLSVLEEMKICNINIHVKYCRPQLAARSNGQVYGRSPAAMVSSNPTGGMDVCM